MGDLLVLLSDPDAEVSSWPLELVALRDKIHSETRLNQEKELSSLRDELSGGEDKWRQRRNLSFDQNRQLEEVTNERDGLKRVAVSLHRVVGQLVAYCARAEDELNRTVLAQLLGRLLPDEHAESSFALDTSIASSPEDLNSSAVSVGRRVHFAPDLSCLRELDEDGVLTFLQQQRDLSADIKRELEHSLARLRQEATELLDLSARLACKRHDSKMLESSQLEITELVQEMDDKSRTCDNCQIHRKNMEEAMAECLQREHLLRSDLDAAMMKIAQLMTPGERMHSSDLVAEGYGTALSQERPWVRPCAGSCVSLDAAPSPRGELAAMARDLDLMQRERDDLQQQLEAANRQLRSTRQFVEEQANEREHERDEFARRNDDLRTDNARLAARLHHNARILNEVEQLETQMREMNQLISDLESRKAAVDEELKARDEKITLLRDIITNLENQLEQKTTHEAEILEQLEVMKRTIEERDGKMRSLLGELESLRSEKAEQSQVTCVNCLQEDDKQNDLLERVKEQCQWLEERIHQRTRRLERLHEVCSAPCSEPSEDVSLRDQRKPKQAGAGDAGDEADAPNAPEAEAELSSGSGALLELLGVWECVQSHSRAADAALKRLRDMEMQRAQLQRVAQEVRAERDVLQARMSEQALKISSLSARLQRHRNDAEALAHAAASHLTVQLHDARAEVQKLKEDLESKDKQLLRLKQNLDEKEKLNEQQQPLYGNSCNPKDKVVILERELSSAQSRIAQLESLTRGLETDKDELQANLRDLQRALAERDEQMQELMALNLHDDNRPDDRSDMLDGGKASARTLSDIVSISEFDEQDLQMRRAELRPHNLSLSGIPHATGRDKLQRTLPPDMSSLNIEYIDHSDLPHCTPRADSLPAHLTSTQNRDAIRSYTRNLNETTPFGIEKPAEVKQNIPDNCSMYPNRDVSDNKNLSVEPKVIDFSVEPSHDNRTHEDEYTSLHELGISLDVKQENFPDILTQLKHEIKKSRSELENCKSDLKNAEEQLCEFPALKEEVDELKNLLENTMATMETDKKFYANQLENFTSNKKSLEQRMSELTQEVNDKSKDLHLLKEDILRRENMILELAKEKRNLTNKMSELEVKIDELQSRNNALENNESEHRQMRERIQELEKLKQLVSEKNQQIDSLNQHLDRLDDLQRCLDDKTEEFDNLKEAFEEKSNELFQMQDTVEALNRDIAKLMAENTDLNNNNKELKLLLTKLEKEQENASLKLQNSESEVERLNSLNGDLTSKIDELKLLNDKLKDKETEIEILHEDINAFHEEIASLKEQLKMVSRSPSPRSKSGEEKKAVDRQASGDKKQLVKIKKQISLLQHELDFNKKELNDKAFELAKAKLDVTELKNNLAQAVKLAADRDGTNAEQLQQLQRLKAERQQLAQQLDALNSRIREESNVSELKAKLLEQVERCQQLEAELHDARHLLDRAQPPGVVALRRSPTAELERALRDQLDYSHALDDHIMEQILSASSDEHEDIPRLTLNTSNRSSSSAQSSASERLRRLRAEHERLQLHASHLELRLRDKDALIAELNRIRDKLSAELQSSQLRGDAERDNAARLQLLLHTHKDTADSLQNQDSNMIQMLKKRLESAMQSEVDLQQQLQHQRARAQQLERRLLAGEPQDQQLQHELDNNERLVGEIAVLKSKLEAERSRACDAHAALDTLRARTQRELDAARRAANTRGHELADAKRLKHEASVELLRAKELLTIQSETITELEKKLTSSPRQKHYTNVMTERDYHKSSPAAHPPHPPHPPPPAPADRDQAVRYLHGRCLRLESCRKALVWQKRYLQRVLGGYAQLERALRPRAPPPPPARRFKCVALAVVVTLRMAFLVRRRLAVRALAASCILRAPAADNDNSQQSVSTPPARSPPQRLQPPSHRDVGDFVRQLPYSISSPREDPFILSPGSAFASKLGLLGRSAHKP